MSVDCNVSEPLGLQQQRKDVPECLSQCGSQHQGKSVQGRALLHQQFAQRRHREKTLLRLCVSRVAIYSYNYSLVPSIFCSNCATSASKPFTSPMLTCIIHYLRVSCHDIRNLLLPPKKRRKALNVRSTLEQLVISPRVHLDVNMHLINKRH